MLFPAVISIGLDVVLSEKKGSDYSDEKFPLLEPVAGEIDAIKRDSKCY